MKFVGLLSLICVFCFAVSLFDVSEAKFKKIKIAKKVAKLLLLRGALRPKYIVAVPLPLPLPIPIFRKQTVQAPTSWDSWGSSGPHSTTSYEIPSLSSLPESILSLLRPALNSIAASAALKGNNQAWSVNSMPALDSWSPPIESWPSAPVSVPESSWSTGSSSKTTQQQQEVVEQTQTNNY